MKARRKRSDPQATRYRVAVTALAKAEKRHAAAEKAIAELRRKVKAYERRIPPERRAEIEAGTVAAKTAAKARADAWKVAERTLRAVGRVAGRPVGAEIWELSSPATNRKQGLFIKLPEDKALVWDVRRGWLTGNFKRGVLDRASLKKPAHDPIEFLQAAE